MLIQRGASASKNNPECPRCFGKAILTWRCHMKEGLTQKSKTQPSIHGLIYPQGTTSGLLLPRVASGTSEHAGKTFCFHQYCPSSFRKLYPHTLTPSMARNRVFSENFCPTAVQCSSIKIKITLTYFLLDATGSLFHLEIQCIHSVFPFNPTDNL